MRSTVDVLNDLLLDASIRGRYEVALVDKKTGERVVKISYGRGTRGSSPWNFI